MNEQRAASMDGISNELSEARKLRAVAKNSGGPKRP
jgi:hypothetical protein